jgi:hypothetical protein
MLSEQLTGRENEKEGRWNTGRLEYWKGRNLDLTSLNAS